MCHYEPCKNKIFLLTHQVEHLLQQGQLARGSIRHIVPLNVSQTLLETWAQGQSIRHMCTLKHLTHKKIAHKDCSPKKHLEGSAILMNHLGE